MKKCILALIILLMLACAAAQAVELQQGWYAWFGGVSLVGNSGQYSTCWSPTSQLGQFGSLTISQWEGYPDSRKLMVTGNMSVAPGIIFEDSGTFDAYGHTYSEVFFSWETNYDANKIRLQLYKRRMGQEDELVWQQTASGHQVVEVGAPSVWDSEPIYATDQLIFKVVAVPEPMSSFILVYGLPMFIWKLRRGK